MDLQNYPKTEKYISLFPPEARHVPGAQPVHKSSSTEESATDAKREELRHRVRGMMEAGDLSGEPELLEGKDAGQAGKSRTTKGASSDGKKVTGQKQRGSSNAGPASEDDFFDDQGSEESDEKMDQDQDDETAGPSQSQMELSTVNENS